VEPEYQFPKSATNITVPGDTNYSVLAQGISLTGRTTPNSIIAVKRGGKYLSSYIATTDTFILRDLPLVYGKNHLTVWAIGADGRIILIDSVTVNYASGQFSMLAQPVYRVQTDYKQIALTFDAGSAANGADSIIRILQDFEIYATIFLTGQFIKRFPKLVLQLDAQGHELANHSLTHPHLTTWAEHGNHNTLPDVNRGFLHKQLQGTDSLYFNLTGKRINKFWRAPYGEYNSEILRWAAEIGYRHIGWSPGCDTFDWVADTTSALYRTPQALYDHLMYLEEQNKLVGAILLMHLNSNRELNHAYTILPRLITDLQKKGYEFVPISTLLGIHAPL
jgi:peptidoglycan/xylan/chitin deacetylase (PgdA/CDA1 family)